MEKLRDFDCLLGDLGVLPVFLNLLPGYAQGIRKGLCLITRDLHDGHDRGLSRQLNPRQQPSAGGLDNLARRKGLMLTCPVRTEELLIIKL